MRGLDQGVGLQEAGSCPILILSEQPASELESAIRHGLELTVYSHAQLDAIAAAGGRDHPVHLKIDTGMRRVGAAADDALDLAAVIATSAAVRLAGIFTHLAVADRPADPFTAAQIEAFNDVVTALAVGGYHAPLVHAANSAATLAMPTARFEMVRVGIAMYGISPGPEVDQFAAPLRPALSLRARVSYVKRVREGDHISYGLRHRFGGDTTVATLPLGYADGVSSFVRLRRRVLIGGRRLTDRRHCDDGPDDGRLRRRSGIRRRRSGADR
jgi:alanine racemase